MTDDTNKRWVLVINEHGSVVGQWAPGCSTVEVMPVSEYERELLIAVRKAAEVKSQLGHVLGEVSRAERLLSPGMKAGTAEAKAILRECLYE